MVYIEIEGSEYIKLQLLELNQHHESKIDGIEIKRKAVKPPKGTFGLTATDIAIYASSALAIIKLIKQIYQLIIHKDKATVTISINKEKTVKISKEMTVKEIEELCKEIK